MVDFLSGLLTAAGGTAEGAGKAIQNDALIKLKNEAMELRDKRIAKLRGDNFAASDAREFTNQGLLNQEKYKQESKESAKDRLSREKIAEDKGYDSLDMVKEYNDSFNRNLKSLSGDGGLPIDDTMIKKATKITDNQWKRMGLPIPTEEKPEGGDGDVTFDSLDAATKEVNSVGNPDPTETGKPDPSKPAPGGIGEEDLPEDVEPKPKVTHKHSFIPDINLDLDKEKLKESKEKIKKQTLKSFVRPGPGQSKPGLLKPEKKPLPSKKTMPKQNESGLLSPKEIRQLSEFKETEHEIDGLPVYLKDGEYYVLEREGMRKLTKSEVQELPPLEKQPAEITTAKNK